MCRGALGLGVLVTHNVGWPLGELVLVLANVLVLGENVGWSVGERTPLSPSRRPIQ